jgi:hypothetical protein
MTTLTPSLCISAEVDTQLKDYVGLSKVETGKQPSINIGHILCSRIFANIRLRASHTNSVKILEYWLNHKYGLSLIVPVEFLQKGEQKSKNTATLSLKAD